MKYIFSILICGSLLISCNDNKEKAGEVYSFAVKQYESGELIKAKITIDSLKNSYPKEFDLIKSSIQLMRKIELKENEKTYNYADSLLKILIPDADALKSNFDYVKSEFEDKGTFIYKGMSVERNVERSYLRSGVYDDGDIYLASVYFGAGKINHTGITVDISNTDFTASTQNIAYDGGTNYRFTDGGNTSEIITYKKGKDNGIIALDSLILLGCSI